MDSVKEQLKVLLVRRPASNESGDAWLRLEKALRTLSQLEIVELNLGDSIDDIDTNNFSHVFIDIGSLALEKLAKLTLEKITFVGSEFIDWSDLSLRQNLVPALSKNSFLNLNGLNAAELVRTLHLYLTTKRLAGVTPLLEKGSVVVAEKVQSTESVGALLDRLAQFLATIDGFQLKSRTQDLKMILSGLIHEGFERAEQTGQTYPTVDFQVGATQQKIVVNLRYPRGNLEFSDIRADLLGGANFVLQAAWQSSDLFIATHHSQYDEVELMLVLSGAQRSAAIELRSLLVKTSDRSLKKDNLLSAPQNFDFRLLADVRINSQDQIRLSTDLSQDAEIDLGSLPEAVVEKFEKISEEKNFFESQSRKKAEQLKEAAMKIVEANREISQKRSELLRVTKGSEALGESLNRKISHLEKRLALAQQAPALQATTKDSGASPAALQDSITKLEATIKANENEKNQLSEKVANEQKKVTAFEQRYSALHKDLGAKDAEIRDVKAQLLKARKEHAQAAAAAASGQAANASAGFEGLQAKLKEAEGHEASLRQELKKAAFKAETTEKHLKAAQVESTEKIKLLEQKLQGAKTKEVELLKKVDELLGALKKASKVA